MNESRRSIEDEDEDEDGGWRMEIISNLCKLYERTYDIFFQF